MPQSLTVRGKTPTSIATSAASLLRRGNLVAFPTETVYGLGANALDAAAVARIFRAKGRPADNPVIVHVSSRRMLRRVARVVPAAALKLIDAFWPGPLTLVLPKRAAVPLAVTAGLPTVAVRMPAHPVALDLIRRAGVPVAAPSANRSGRPSPTTAAHVREDFPNLTVLDGGPTEHGVESTVVAVPVSGPPRVLRLGAIPVEALRRVVPGLLGPRRRSGGGEESADGAGARSGAPESPGIKYRHYAPGRRLTLFEASEIDAARAYAAAHPRALVLCRDRDARHFPPERVVSLGQTVADVARNLFAALRTRRKGSELVVVGVARRGLGRTVMDRLERAAGGSGAPPKRRGG